MRRNNLVFSFLISNVYFAFGCAFATTVEPRTLEELANVAPVVVYGKVVQLDVEASTGRRTAVLEATEVAKGPAEFLRSRDFYIPLLNRALPHSEAVEVYAGAPELSPGEEIVAFLRPIEVTNEGPFHRPDGRRVFALQGFQQGKWRVVTDRAGVRRALSWTDWPAAPVDLRRQKSTPRLPRSKARPSGAALQAWQSQLSGLPSDLERFSTLDAVLNLARGAR